MANDIVRNLPYDTEKRDELLKIESKRCHLDTYNGDFDDDASVLCEFARVNWKSVAKTAPSCISRKPWISSTRMLMSVSILDSHI